MVTQYEFYAVNRRVRTTGQLSDNNSSDSYSDLGDRVFGASIAVLFTVGIGGLLVEVVSKPYRDRAAIYNKIENQGKSIDLLLGALANGDKIELGEILIATDALKVEALTSRLLKDSSAREQVVKGICALLEDLSANQSKVFEAPQELKDSLDYLTSTSTNLKNMLELESSSLNDLELKLAIYSLSEALEQFNYVKSKDNFINSLLNK